MACYETRGTEWARASWATSWSSHRTFNTPDDLPDLDPGDRAVGALGDHRLVQ